MIKNSLKFSPVITDGFTKAHPKSLEFKEWWREQRRRCLEGYKVGRISITGRHYFYLNFWKIRGIDKTGRKGYIAPRFLEMDYNFFNEFDKARDEGYFGMVVLKSRQKGFSEKAASITAHEFSFFPHSQSIVVAGEDKYTKPVMSMIKKGLNNLAGSQFYKKKYPNKVDYIRAAYKALVGGEEVVKGYMSEVFSYTANNNPQVLIGRSPSFIYFEEAGRFSGVKEVYNYIKPAMEAEGKVTGFALFVGTGGEMEGGVEELEELFYEPDAYGLKPFDNIHEPDVDIEDPEARKVGYFVPATHFEIIDKDGNNLIEESTIKLEAEREVARKAKDGKKFHDTITQKPFYPSEALMRTGGNLFNAAKLNERLATIKNNQKLANMVDIGRLDWIRDEKGFITGVDFVLDADGYCKIVEHPEINENGDVYKNLYIGATDSYDRDQSAGEGSKGSCQIYKRFLNADTTSQMYVARITTRPKTSAEFYEMTAKLMVYYGYCQNLIEYSNLLIFQWYEQNQFSYLLKERPRVAYANVANSKVQNRYGIDPQTKQFWLTSLRDWIENNCHNLYDIEQIEALIKFKDEKGYNCDITISSSLCVVHDLDNYKLKTQEKKPEKFKFFGYTSENGKIQTI